MAVSVTTRLLDNPGGIRFAAGSITFDSSYPTGGEAVSNTQWGVATKAPDFVFFHPRATDTGGVDLQSVAWNRSTGKVQAYWVDTTSDDQPLDEVTDTTSEATFVVDFLAVWIDGYVAPTTV